MNPFSSIPSVFAVLIVLIPLLGYLANQRRLRRLEAAWRSEAARLGLTAFGSAPALRISGVLDGVEVTLVQTVHERYKQAPLMWFTARARLPALGPEEILASYRTEPRRAEDPRQHDVFAGAVPIDGWIEHTGDGEIDPRTLEDLLGRLARTARAAAEAQAEQQERERKQAGRS